VTKLAGVEMRHVHHHDFQISINKSALQFRDAGIQPLIAESYESYTGDRYHLICNIISTKPSMA